MTANRLPYAPYVIAAVIAGGLVYVFATHPGGGGTSLSIPGFRADPARPSAAAPPSATEELAPAPGSPLAAAMLDDAGAAPKRLDAAQREALRTAILHRLWKEAAPWLTPWDGGWTSPPVGEPLPPAYVQERIHRDLVPLAKTCFKDLRSRPPDAGAQVYFRFTLIAHVNLGGLFTTFELDPASTLADAAFTTCIRDALLGLVFPPPQTSGATTMMIPLALGPDGASSL